MCSTNVRLLHGGDDDKINDDVDDDDDEQRTWWATVSASATRSTDGSSTTSPNRHRPDPRSTSAQRRAKPSPTSRPVAQWLVKLSQKKQSWKKRSTWREVRRLPTVSLEPTEASWMSRWKRQPWTTDLLYASRCIRTHHRSTTTPPHALWYVHTISHY